MREDNLPIPAGFLLLNGSGGERFSLQLSLNLTGGEIFTGYLPQGKVLRKDRSAKILLPDTVLGESQATKIPRQAPPLVKVAGAVTAAPSAIDCGRAATVPKNLISALRVGSLNRHQ